MKLSHRLSFLLLVTMAGINSPAIGQSFRLPTANRAIYEPGQEEKFFAPTPGKDWQTGTFGCVRTDGHQMHEGLDIRCLQRDRKGEPTDPVMSTADGVIAYINRKSGLSNYGNYVVVRHQIEGVELYSLYAHLHEIREDLKPGQAVRGGEQIAIMGRTTNTRERISQDRAHVHFELNFFVNDRFSNWYDKAFPGQRNDHGAFNGQNLTGIDPRLILLDQQAKGTNFSLVNFLRKDTELCRVFVRKTDFPWLKRYPPLVWRNLIAEREGVAGYEIALDYNALPFQLIPRALSEIKTSDRFKLISVNEDEAQRHSCRKLVAKKNGRWELTTHGVSALELLTY